MATGTAGLVLADKLPAIGEAFEATYRIEATFGTTTAGHSFDAILKAYYEPFIVEQLNRKNPLSELFAERGEWIVPEGGAILRRRNSND